MISSRSSGRSSRWTRPYFGTSCSISRRIRSVAEIAGRTPSSSKCWRLRGLLQRATTRVTPYFSRATCEIRMLSSSSPVTATTRSARSMPARSSTHSSEPSPYCALCSSSRARFQPTLPAPTIRTYMASAGDPFEADLPAHRRLEQLDRGLRGTDRLEALLGVPARPGRVEDPHDHAVDVEAALGDLRDHEVGVVAVGRGHERVRLLDARGE